MELKIYNQQGLLKASVSPSDSDRHVKEVMNDNVLNLSFTLYEYVELSVNDYVDFDGERFTLLEDYKPEQNSTVEYVYKCKFYGIESELKKAKVLKLVDNENELSFSYDTTAADHLRLICDNINRIKGADTWRVGEVISTGNVNIEYDNMFCFDALSEIAKKFDTEWWIDGSTINLSRCEHGTIVPLGYGKGLRRLTRVANDTVPFFTRLYPLGSTRNIVQSDYGYKRLQLPGGVRYVEKNIHLGIVEQSEEHTFSGIYPRRIGNVSTVRSMEATGEDGNKYTIYYFTDSSLNFDPNDYEIDGLVKNIAFQSGELKGRDFEVNFKSRTKEFEIITQFPYENQQLPGGLLIPKPGDTYVLYNIRMPKEYYRLAEQEYAEAVDEYLDKISIDTSVYKAPTDYVYLAENGIFLKIGQRVRLESNIYFPDGVHESRVTRISRKVNNIADMDVEFSYAVDYGRINQIETNIVNIQAAYKEQLNKDVMTVLKSWDNQDATDYSLMTALRIIREIEKKALSKEKSDRTPYSLEVGEDLTVDGNASVNHDLNVGRNATVGNDLTVMEILRALIKIETAALSVSGNSKTGTLDVAGKATAHDVEVANQVTTLNAVIRALATIHNLTVDNTADIMHGIIRQYLSSDKFVSGFLGEGFKVWQDAAGLWHGELDMLTVRKVFTVFEIVVQKVVHQGGMVIRSAAGGKITKVTDGGSYWRCEHDSTDDFVTNDQVLCQVFTGTKMKRYWRLVTSAGAGYFNLSKSDCEAGSATPEVGDEVAVLGNRTNVARQSAQIDCAVGANAPYRDDYAGINSYSLAGKLVTRTGNLSGIVDPDFGALSGYGLYSLNAYLKGMLRLVSGKTVETAIGEARSGAISVAASDAQAKANAAKASAIAAAAGDAQAKADAAKQAAISAAASDAQSKATAAETNAKAHTQAILDGLKLGGRNYVILSKLRSYTPYNTTPTVSDGVITTTVKDGITHITIGVTGYTPTVGETYTVSGVMKKNGAPVTNAQWLYKATSTYNMPQSFKVDDATGRFEATMRWSRDNVWLIHTDIEGAAGSAFTFEKLKFETGTKATDWTPAPEDVEAGIAFEITKVRTDFDVREGQISSKVAEVAAKTQQAVSAAETATSKANDASGAATRAAGSATAAAGSASAAASEAGKARSSADTAAAKLITVTEKESNINQTAGQIATGVAEVTRQADIASNAANNANTALQTVSTKQTQINQTAAEIDLKATRAEQAAGAAEAAEARINLSADGIVLQASKQAAQQAVDGVQIGGRNLLALTSLVYGTRLDAGFRGRLWANTIWNPAYIASKLKPSTQYTLSYSVAVHALSSLPPSDKKVGLALYNGTKIILFIATTTPEVGKTYEFCHTFTTPANLGNYRLIAYSARFVDGNTAELGEVSFLNVQMEEGNKKTGWGLAQEDIDANAQAKADAAKSGAISAAASDAQAKADAAKQSAISDAAAKYPTKTEYSAQLAVLNNSISSKVSQTDFTALSTRMSTAEQKITPASIISTVSSTVESAKTAAINAAASDAKAKADAAKSGAISAAASDAQAKANAAENNAKAHANSTFTPLTTYNTKVAQLENLISLKAESSTVSGLTTRMAAAEAKITPDAINLTVKEQITTAVGNVQVGGRNYVILSKLQSWIAATSVPVITDTDVNVMLKADGTTNQQLVIRVKDYFPDAGAYYTVSGYMTLGGRPIKNTDFIVKRANYALGTDNFFVDDASGYFECTHKYNGSDPWLLNAKLTAATGTPVKISKFKFEKGTKASDWTLSPEDADAALQIGGSNLYRKSAVIHNLINNPTIQKEVDANSVHGFKLTGKQSLVCGVRIRNVISENGDYVISFWGKSNGSGTPKFDICNNPCTGDATFTTEWKRFELRAKVNNYSADGYHFIDIENIAFLYYWFKDFKVEKGTKATDWTPAPEDVEADIALRPTKEEVKAGISITTGGINVFGKEISLAGKVTFASLDSSTQATINGKATTAALTSLQNSLGAMAYQNMVSLAKLDTTIVQGGYIKTNLIDANAVITNSLLATKIAATDITTGRLTVIDGAKVAGFRVSGNNLSNMDNAGNFLNDASIVFRNDTMKCFAGIGGNVMPASTGLRAVARFENEDTSDQWGLRANYALIVSAKGAKRYDDMVASGNHAIYISNGDICGLRLKARRISVNTTLTTMDSIVFVVKTGVTVTLPGSGVEDGQIYFIRNHCSGTCRIAGNNIRAWNDGGVGNSFELNRSNMAILMYDAHNNTWTANWTGNW